MKHRSLGSTGITVPLLGLGTVKFGRNQGVKYPQAFNLPQDQELRELLALSLDLGVNLLDTAPAYGFAEERLGKLRPGSRHQWKIITKAGEQFTHGQSHFDFSANGIQRSVENSLRTLRTDYLDGVLIHSNGDDLKLIEESDCFAPLAKMKQKGHILSYGMSSKTIKGGLKALELADYAMVTYNSQFKEESEVIDQALHLKKGILVKKALGSGHMSAKEGEESLQFVAENPGVSSIIVGSLNPLHLKANVKIICGS